MCPQVGCTCLSVNSPLLTCQSFGVVILDEASQVTLPASLGPLALGRSFLLVGDHYQLSPLVQSREAAAGGLGVSLFRRLSEAHPQVSDRAGRRYMRDQRCLTVICMGVFQGFVCHAFGH